MLRDAKIPTDRGSLLNLDIEGLTASQIKLAVENIFGPAPGGALANRLAPHANDLKMQHYWRVYSGLATPEVRGEPYWATHTMLVALAKYTRPKVLGARVTDFSSWVLSLYWNMRDSNAMRYGKEVEREVESRRNVARYLPAPCNPEWKLEYRDPLTYKPDALAISALKVNGACMWGAPDLVFRHLPTQNILIIDRKATHRAIPRDGWPNARAQLWAYAHADRWRDAPRITLVEEVWGHVDGTIPVRRHILRWEFSDPKFQRENRELFALYLGATIEESAGAKA